jgi:hypothetical protein
MRISGSKFKRPITMARTWNVIKGGKEVLR